MKTTQILYFRSAKLSEALKKSAQQLTPSYCKKR